MPYKIRSSARSRSPMKTFRNRKDAAIYVLLLLFPAVLGIAQGTFQNLDFDASLIPEDQAHGFVSVTDAMPGWTAYISTNAQTQIGFNAHRWAGPPFPSRARTAPLASPPSIVPYQGSSAAIALCFRAALEGRILCLLMHRSPRQALYPQAQNRFVLRPTGAVRIRSWFRSAVMLYLFRWSHDPATFLFWAQTFPRMQAKPQN